MKSNIIRIGALLLMIFFFIPYFSVSCSNQTFSINGADITFGKDIAGQNFAGNILMILLLLLPIAVLIITFIKKYVKFEGISAVISSILCIILLSVAYSSISQKASEAYAVFKAEIGFYLAIIVNIAIIAVVGYDQFIKKPRNTESPPIEK